MMKDRTVFKKFKKHFTLFLVMGLLQACTGETGSVDSGGGDGDPPPEPASGPDVTLNVSLKQLVFSWPAVKDASYYRVLENADGVSGFTVIPGADSISETSFRLEASVHLIDWANARYIVEACNSAKACKPSTEQTLSLTDAMAAIGYVKASNTDVDDRFGHSVALSGDGTTMVVGVPREDSNAVFGTGGEDDNSANNAGAVYVFAKTGSGWVQQAYLKAPNTDVYDRFGWSVALDASGNTLAIGAWGEESNAVFGSGGMDDNSAPGAGAVYIYTRSGGSWSHQAYIKAPDTQSFDSFGMAVALNADGTTLAVGAENAGVKVSGFGPGKVYVYTLGDSGWMSPVTLVADNGEAEDRFGAFLALDDSGNRLVVGAPYEDSATRTIDGDGADNNAMYAGAVYVFDRVAGSWSQQAYLKADNADGYDYFGNAVALSGDGMTVAIGANWEDSSAVGINPTDNGNATNGMDYGAVYVFSPGETGWVQQAYIKASNTGVSDYFGSSIALSTDGRRMVVGAYGESSTATGVAGDEADDSLRGSGAVYFFQHDGSTWKQTTYVKASNTDSSDGFGRRVDMSADGKVLAVGARGEDGNGKGVNTGDLADDSAFEAGAVYLY